MQALGTEEVVVSDSDLLDGVLHSIAA